MTTRVKPSEMIGTRTVEGYDEPVRIYWTKSVEGRDEDGDRVTFVYTAEDCPDFDPDFTGEQCEPYTVRCATYRAGLDDPANPDDCWDFDCESFDDLADAIERAEEWAAALGEEQIEREESNREGLASSLDDVASEAFAGSDEKAAIETLAVLIQQGKATEVLAALKATGLV